MSRFGQLHEYQASQEPVSAYLERVTLFFQANEIAEEKQVAVFLSVVGATTYALLRDLLAPKKPHEKSLGDLFAALKTHFEPKPLVIEQRFHFHRRDQKPLESIAEYVAELRKAASFCEFGDFMDDALRDRFVCGLQSELAQKRLLTEETLTFARAIDIARGLEAADRSAKYLHSRNDDQVGHVGSGRKEQTDQKGKSEPPKVCFRCNESGHSPGECRFRESACRNCGKKGHIVRACRSVKGQIPRRSRKRPSSRVHMVSQQAQSVSHDPVENALQDELSINQVHTPARRPIMVELVLNGRTLSMQVDTGAAVSLISSATFNRLFPNATLSKSGALLTTYTGEQIPLAGQTEVEVSHNKQCQRLTVYVTKGEGPSLFGREWLRAPEIGLGVH